jgi:hypothetical protein
MAVVDEPVRKTICMVFRICVLVGVWGAFEPARAVSDQPAPAGQEQPATSSDSSAGTGKGSDGQGRGLRPGRKACADDVRKLCAGVKAGEGRIMHCLRAHTQELAPACSELLQQRGKHRP